MIKTWFCIWQALQVLTENFVTDPTLLVVQSDGPAGEIQPGKMGRYILQQKEKFNGENLWKQYNGKNHMFYSKGKYAKFSNEK